ncbi:MAG: GNAT family N-acetyltransferase [Bacteroidota bacterium]
MLHYSEALTCHNYDDCPMDSFGETERLILVGGTEGSLVAELQNRKALADLLGVAVPANWPPPLYDQPAIEFTLKYLKENPDAKDWIFWYIVLREPEPIAIGITGFKGKPSSDGTVEVGYSVCNQFQRNGYASEAVGALIKHAFSHNEVQRVIAETLPDLMPSIKVMEKNGLKFIGQGSEDGVIRYELKREDYAKQKVPSV